MTDRQLPIFTYGTLRPGHHNFGLLADVVVAITPATTEGLQLLDAGPYPYAVHGPGRVHGDLITIDIDYFATTLADLDRLEGFDRHSPAHSHYQRVTTRVITATGDVVLAWVYVAGPTTDTSDCAPIPGGDWTTRPATPGQEPTPMCGIFGTIRPHNYPQAIRRAARLAIADLGYFAEDRGTDSAGIATLGGRSYPASTRVDPHTQRRDTRFPAGRIVTALGPYSSAVPSKALARDIDAASVILGHTRSATRGAVTLDNACPMEIGPLIGTFNGDVDPHSVAHLAPADLTVDSDTAVLLGALSLATSTLAVTETLEAAIGRAALAWTTTGKPRRVHLARASWSPLAVAVDPYGALWWASNPEWLRVVGVVHDLDIAGPVLLPEGTLVTVTATSTAVNTARSRFQPVCRPVDDRIGELVAWRDFTDLDIQTDAGGMIHETTSAWLAPAN